MTLGLNFGLRWVFGLGVASDWNHEMNKGPHSSLLAGCLAVRSLRYTRHASSWATVVYVLCRQACASIACRGWGHPLYSGGGRAERYSCGSINCAAATAYLAQCRSRRYKYRYQECRYRVPWLAPPRSGTLACLPR